MMKGGLSGFTVSLLAVLLLVGPARSQSPSKPVVDPVGEILTSGGSVRINGTVAQRGSTVFSGSEIQTEDASAFVNFTSGGGVLAIAPGSRLKVSREQARIIAQVLEGSVTVRSPLPSTVIAPDRVVTSEADNLYKVSVAPSGTLVESLLKSVVVQAFDGTVQTITAQASNALAEAVAHQKVSPRPDPAQPSQVTNRGDNCFITVLCTVVGNTLTVRGEVSCQGNPVGGATVMLRVFFSSRAPSLGPFTTTSRTSPPYPPSEVGNFVFNPITNPNVSAGGVALVEVRNCGSCKDQPVGGTAGNRCTF